MMTDEILLNSKHFRADFEIKISNIAGTRYTLTKKVKALTNDIKFL